MSNEPTPPAGPGQPSTTPPATPASPFNPDGTFVENWHTMAPAGYEDLREDKTLPRFKNVWDQARSYVSVRKQVPMDKMPRPNENWGEQEWNEFYDAGGRPKTPQDYGVKMPKDFPKDYWDDKKAEKYQETFHKIGLSKKQADALIALNNEETLAVIKDVEQQAEMEFTALKDNLRKKWGRAFEQNTHLGNIAIEKGAKGDEGFKDRLIDKINKDPDLIEYSANLGSLFSEPGVVETTRVPTPGDLQDQIRVIEKDYSSLDKATRMRAVDKVMKLREQIKKDKTG